MARFACGPRLRASEGAVFGEVVLQLVERGHGLSGVIACSVAARNLLGLTRSIEKNESNHRIGWAEADSEILHLTVDQNHKSADRSSYPTELAHVVHLTLGWPSWRACTQYLGAQRRPVPPRRK
jgi:hypothetical protein